MNIQRLYEVFKNVGKIIRLTEISAAAASGVKEHAVAMHVQFAEGAGAGDDFAALQVYLVPAQQKVQPIAAALDRVQTICKANTEAYLRTLAEELSLSATSPTANVLASLAARMNTNGGTIAPSGKVWTYFRDEFGFTGFPQNSSPTLPDSFITTTIL